MSIEERWNKVFDIIDKSKLANIFHIVPYVLSISRMLWLNIKWSNTRDSVTP